MKLKWTRDFRAVGTCEFSITGIQKEYWGRVREIPGEWHSLSLGWSPTLTLAKKRCQDLEDYYSKKKGT